MRRAQKEGEREAGEKLPPVPGVVKVLLLIESGVLSMDASKSREMRL